MLAILLQSESASINCSRVGGLMLLDRVLHCYVGSEPTFVRIVWRFALVVGAHIAFDPHEGKLIFGFYQYQQLHSFRRRGFVAAGENDKFGESRVQ